MIRVTHALSLPLALCASLAFASPQSKPLETGGLVGTWVLNKSESDKDRATPSGPEGRGGRGRGGGAGGIGGGGRGGGRGGGVRGGGGFPGRGDADREAMQQRRDMLDEVMRPTDRLIIIQADSAAVTMTDADGHSRTFSLSGKKEKHQLQNGTIETTSRWDGETLRQEIEADKVKLVRTFAKDADRHQLTVTVSFDDAPRGRPPFRSVYDDAAEQ